MQPIRWGETIRGIVIIVGAYGSGKTEVAVNLAIAARAEGIAVRLADLDLVNPYFRSREARTILKQRGIDVVLPPDQYMQADLPILTPEVSGMLRKPTGLTLLDVGGDDAGATVLAALADSLRGQSISVWQVINPHRPATSTVDGCLQMRRAIEAKAKVPITGIVGNAHLMAATCAQDILDGYVFARRTADQGGLPLVFVTAPAHLLTRSDKKRIDCPVLEIRRQLVPPWLRPDKVGQS